MKILVLYIVSFFTVLNICGQCQPSFSGTQCVNNPIEFNGNSPGSTNFLWNFNGEGSNNNTIKPVFRFTTTGVKIVTFSCTLANGTACSGKLTLTIKPLPIIRTRLLTDSVQCFENNAFCFRDSSLSGDGNNCIVSIKYLFSDGELITKTGTKFNPVSLPATFCKTINDPQGTTVNLLIEVEDCNGCISRYQYPNALKTDFAPALFANFQFSTTPCGATSRVKFTNLSQIKTSDLKSFYWDFGDGYKDSSNWDSISHNYNIGNANTQIFSPKLIVVTKSGCTVIFNLKDITMFNLKPRILLSRDSICVDDTIAYQLLPTSMSNFITERDLAWRFNPGIANQFKGIQSYNTLGPKLINCRISHPCGPFNLYDTLIVIGPKAMIEPVYMDPNKRFQCTIKDSITVTDRSLFYHNDTNILNDDSLFRKKAGNLGHHFTNNISTTARNQIRNGENTIRLWNFGDEYCDQCTTDFQQNKNTWLNCNYSREKTPQHWYTPWDSVYRYKFSFLPFEITFFNGINQSCSKRRIFSSDSLFITTDTVLYYGNNTLGKTAKDSTVFLSLKKQLIPSGIIGKGSLDCPFNIKIYIPSQSQITVDRKNGLGLLNITGPSYFNINKNWKIQVDNSDDSCLFIYSLLVNIDSIPLQEIQPHHNIIGSTRNPRITSFDSINFDLHRKLFYERIPKCYPIELIVRDTLHPLACESRSTVNVALLPPSAKKLSIDNQFCYGYTDKIIEFSLSDTKPGCTQSLAKINFDYINTPNDWELINDLYDGDLRLGPYLNSEPPYKGYANQGPFNTIFFKKFSDSILSKKGIQKLNIALIIGNGTGSNYCEDTAYYPNFASFPFLNANFNILSKLAKNVYHVCPNEPICVNIPIPQSREYNQLAYANNWYFINHNTGDTVQKITETYYKVQSNVRYPNQKVNFVVIKRYDAFKNGLNPIQTDTIFTAIIHKHHVKLLKSINNQKLKDKLTAIGLSIDDFSDSLLVSLIWNRIGTIGDKNSGSKGCIDTTGFGNELFFEYVIDSTTILHFKDTSFNPLDQITKNGKNFQSYCFSSPKSGAYKMVRNIETNYPNYCPLEKEQLVIVGFYGDMTVVDSIICAGQAVEINSKLRYYSADTSLYGALDTIDYWTLRENEAGNINREGRTIWDFSKQDDNPNNPNTIFGVMPYGRLGLANPTLTIGNEPGGIYYKQAGFYTLRMLTSDSNRCVDTFKQNLYVLGPKAGFFIDFNRPNCKTIIELFDTSKIIDPCVLKGLPPCDDIIYWAIDWGDGSPLSEYYKDRPAQIGHDFIRNGKFRIWLYISTAKGCRDSVFMDIDIPGPLPTFIVETESTICVNDSVLFKNVSRDFTKSAQWLWSFGDGQFQPQKDTGLVWHQYKQTGIFDVYLTQYDSIENSGKYCSSTFPDTLNKIRITVLPYDQINLSAVPNIVCVGDSITIKASINTFATYQNYFWSINQNTSTTTIPEKTFQLKQKGSYFVIFSPILSGLGQKTCSTLDTITVYADSVFANFDIDTTQEPKYCFTNTSTNGVKYRWGFFHTDDITKNKNLVFIENATQVEPERYICQDFFQYPGYNWICLEATNAIGCKDTICKRILNNYERAVIPPNVFTPSGKDGFSGKDKDQLEGNNVFNIYLKGESFYDLKIYDRWGVLVFESKDKNYDWNGRLFNTGEECMDGTYYYILNYRYKSSNENEPPINGVVRVIWDR